VMKEVRVNLHFNPKVQTSKAASAKPIIQTAKNDFH